MVPRVWRSTRCLDVRGKVGGPSPFGDGSKAEGHHLGDEHDDRREPE
jgi:hypothetical protein